mmetsp:Transcript_1184/g.2787  ORF Transcript_1184/g.2787 Transcript_1184/m.2787 type:complete len:155 (-) Transcript_1184:69-533(-)
MALRAMEIITPVSSGVGSVPATSLPRSTAPQGADMSKPSTRLSSTMVKALTWPLALGLAFRVRRRGRVARAGAPPKPIWKTKRRSAVAQLERQWLLPAEVPTDGQATPAVSSGPPQAEELPQAFLRFLGGSVLMAVLAQASFLGKRGPELPPGA